MKLQRGMALLVCLVLMLLCGLLGVSVLHSAALQARMAGNLVMALQAFEAAEATLRLAEARVLAGLEPPGPCVYCLPPPEAPRVRAAGVQGGAGPSSGLGWQAQGPGFFLVQNLGRSSRPARLPDDLEVQLLRVTAVGRQQQARVVLESVLAQPVVSAEWSAQRILWRQIH